MARATKIIVLVLFLLIATGLTLTLTNPELHGQGTVALATFFGVIVLEVIFAPVPGGLIGFLGASHFGFWKAWPVMYFANIVGGVLVFSLARWIGKEYVEEHVDEKKYKKYSSLLEKKPWTVWLVYAVPVFPIDMISAVLGLSALERKKYVKILVVALPFYTGITAALGAYLGGIIPYVTHIATAAFILLLLFIGYVLVRNWHR